MYQKKRLRAGLLAAAVTATCLAALPAPVTYAEVTLVEDRFETDYDGWTNQGIQTLLTADTAAAHNSARGMRVTNRQTSEDGVYSEKGFYLEGGDAYHYSVWVRQDTAAQEDFSLQLRYLAPDGETYTTVPLAQRTAAAGTWTELTADYTAPTDTVNLTLFLSSASTTDFCFDDVTVTGVQEISTGTASAAEVGLKDIYANYFRFGTCLPSSGLNNSTRTALVLREFNSVTCENELKPDSTMSQGSSSGTNVGVSLSSAASILNFCVQNGIAMRGHTFVWHSQTPDWVFKENFNANGSWVSSSVMNQRMESYIKNMFAAIASQYPSLNLYAYDVCNECFSDNGGPRTAGSNNTTSGNSAWVQVYGDNSFIEQAFTYAKKYAPATCKLFYNDYNEYMGQKHKDICTLATSLYNKGLLDGVGMQSHLGASYPDLSTYKTALTNFSAIGCEVQVTELDIETSSDHATHYKNIVQAVVDADKNYGKVTALVVWGTTDDTSWRSNISPLLFNSGFNKKAAYTAVASIIPESEWGDGGTPSGGSGGGSTGETDEDGYFFHSTFETGNDSWDPRGSASAVRSNAAAYAGSYSLAVTDRADTWNGTARSLATTTFVPGTAYSFSAMVMQNASAAEDIYLTLQYDLDGEANYAQIATATAAKGAWTKLENTAYTIPAGASNLLIYLETPENLIDFYVDEAIGAPAGTANPGSSTYGKGDVNHSGSIDSKDASLLLSYLLRRDVTIFADTADVNGDGTVNAFDLALLKKAVLSGTAGTTTTAATTATNQTTTTTTVQLAAGQWNNQADISGIDTAKPMVAFTFDDGPVGTADSDTSIRIQNALSTSNAHATFFYWGNRISSSNRAEIARAQSLGFEIGNHTYSHSYLTGLSGTQVQSEIQQCANLLTEITGLDRFLIRPPYLSTDATVLANAGAPMINCNTYSMDWEGASASAIINTITTAMNNGSLDNGIVLMHETYSTTAEAIEYLAPYMKQQGWQIVSVSQLFKANGKDLWAGQVYSACN